jgi:hypothetical protein
MKARSLRKALRHVRTPQQWQEMVETFSWAWAGQHRGRRRVVRLLERAQVDVRLGRLEVTV